MVFTNRTNRNADLSFATELRGYVVTVARLISSGCDWACSTKIMPLENLGKKIVGCETILINKQELVIYLENGMLQIFHKMISAAWERIVKRNILHLVLLFIITLQ